MAYSELAKARRRCTKRRKDGEPCGAWAVWGDARQLCASHGRHHRGPQTNHRRDLRTRFEPCTCAAYNWPHRPGGGVCRWPEPPTLRLTTPTSTHAWPRCKPEERTLIRKLSRRYGRAPVGGWW